MATIPGRSTSVDPKSWHNRYTQQAGWTAKTRKYLYQLAGLSAHSRIVEPGCGTGAILADNLTSNPHGLDWDYSSLKIARNTVPSISLVCGNGLMLPYADSVFDACLTHFFLLWVKQDQALTEMCRVTRPGGVILALAEPDYGSRIDCPLELAELGQLQGKALQRQGADPITGRKLASLFIQAGLERVTTGVMGGEWGQQSVDDGWEQEWAALQSDLSGEISTDRLSELRRIDAAAWGHGERILFVPTFYAIGWIRSN